MLTLYFVAKSKNKSSENGLILKTRVFLNAALIANQTPENQYIELKHNVTNSKESAPFTMDLKSNACDMQINFGSPVEPDEQESNAAYENGSLISLHLRDENIRIQINPKKRKKNI